MFKNKLYTFSEFNSIIKESANEFKPKIGKNVDRDNKSNNEKAVNDILKQTSKLGASLNKKQEFNPQLGENSDDENKTTLDYDFYYEPNDGYKDRVKSQVHGFSSVDDEKNKKEKEKDIHDNNVKFYEKQKSKNKYQIDMEQDDKAAGLKSRELDKSYFKDNTLYKNESKKKKMKLIHYKHTLFVNEENMLKKVPDCMKTDGNTFVMMDMSGTRYLVECKIDDQFHFAKLNVVNKCNPEQVKEQLSRIRELSEYNSGDYFAAQTPSEKLNEDKNLGKYINNVRQIEKNNIKNSL